MNLLFMLAKKYRLTKNKDFERVAKFGQVIYSQELIIKWIKNNLPVSRFGIIVSAKVAKRANIRNKIKRRLREIIKKILLVPKLKTSQIMTIKSGYDIMILVKQSAVNLNYWQLKEKLEILFKKAQLLI